MTDDSYLIEYQRIGSIAKVTAVDPATGTEAVIQGPANVGERMLAQAAIKKLEYLLRQKHGKNSGSV